MTANAISPFGLEILYLSHSIVTHLPLDHKLISTINDSCYCDFRQSVVVVPTITDIPQKNTTHLLELERVLIRQRPPYPVIPGGMMIAMPAVQHCRWLPLCGVIEVFHWGWGLTYVDLLSAVSYNYLSIQYG